MLAHLELSKPQDLIGWAYRDTQWQRFAALSPLATKLAAEGDQGSFARSFVRVQATYDALSITALQRTSCAANCLVSVCYSQWPNRFYNELAKASRHLCAPCSAALSSSPMVRMLWYESLLPLPSS